MGRSVPTARRSPAPAIALTLALALATLACGGGEEERDAAVALALLLDNQERCEAVADEVAETRARAGSAARSAVAGYYEGQGAGATAAVTRGLEILETAMAPLGRAEGEVRDALLELELPLRLRGLGLAVADCQRLLEATDQVNRISLLTAPDDRVNATLAAAVDLFQRAARSCTDAQLDLAYEAFAEADVEHREVVRLLSLYELDPGP